jgi:thiol-disulfide isomerase/thioredoxin
MSPGRRELLILGGVAAAAAVAGGVVGALALQARTGAADLLSSQLPDLTGRMRRVAEWQGRALLCNFWATWCAPCREEVPLLVAAKEKLPPHGTEIVGIGIDSASNIREFATKYRINYPLLVGEATALTLLRNLGNRTGGLPYTVGLDRYGAIAERRLGALKETELRQVLASLDG